MSVENPINYPSSSTSGNGGSRSVDTAALNALSDAFVRAVQRSFSALDSGKDKMLDAADESLRSAAGRKEEEFQNERRNRSVDSGRDPAGRKTLDRSEDRQGGLESDYLGRLQRREAAQERHAEKAETRSTSQENEKPENVQIRESLPATGGPSFTAASISPPGQGQGVSFGTALRENIVRENIQATPTTNSAGQVGPDQASAAASSVTPLLLSQAGSPVVMPGAGATSGAGSAGVSGQIPTPGLLGTAAVMTVFTAGGRLENGRGSTKEKDGDDLKKKDKRDRSDVGFGFFAQETPPETTVRRTLIEIPSENRSEQAVVMEIRSEPDSPAPQGEGDSELLEETIREILRKLNPEDVRPTPETAPAAAQVASAAGSTTEEQRERILLVKRVAAACRSAAQQSGTLRVKIHLNEQLGSLTLRMTARKEHISVRFEATTKRAGRLLAESAEELRKKLAEERITLDVLEIRVLSRETGMEK